MRCCTCKQEKDISEFHKNKPSCKECRKIERKKSYENRKEVAYDEMLAYNKEWAKNNPDKRAQYNRTWCSKNRDKSRLHCNKRYSYAKQARPQWADPFLIEEAYHLAQLRTKATGIRWEVDHIIPLRGKDVCGLHVENNLQVIPRSLNASKQHRYIKQYNWSDFFKA